MKKHSSPVESGTHNGTAEAPAALPSTSAGGCACGRLRYTLLREPLFVHCCHCTRCQRETGGPFAHHAMVEFSALHLVQGQPDAVKVPTDSGRVHWVMRCPECRTALWNEHGSRAAITCYVRVGTLDEPQRWPPQAHIYVRSRQAWLRLDAGAPCFDAGYNAATTWPASSLQRWAAAQALRREEKAARAAQRAPASAARPNKASISRRTA